MLKNCDKTFHSLPDSIQRIFQIALTESMKANCMLQQSLKKLNYHVLETIPTAFKQTHAIFNSSQIGWTSKKEFTKCINSWKPRRKHRQIL